MLFKRMARNNYMYIVLALLFSSLFTSTYSAGRYSKTRPGEEIPEDKLPFRKKLSIGNNRLI